MTLLSLPPTLVPSASPLPADPRAAPPRAVRGGPSRQPTGSGLRLVGKTSGICGPYRPSPGGPRLPFGYNPCGGPLERALAEVRIHEVSVLLSPGLSLDDVMGLHPDRPGPPWTMNDPHPSLAAVLPPRSVPSLPMLLHPCAFPAPDRPSPPKMSPVVRPHPSPLPSSSSLRPLGAPITPSRFDH